MTATNTNAYRPISTTETDTEDPVSVHGQRTQCDNINNAVVRVFNHPRIETRIANTSQVTDLVSPSSSIAETVVLFLGHHHIAPCYTHVRWNHVSRRYATNGSGIDYTTWRLVFAYNLYQGDEVYNSGKLLQPMSSTSRSDTADWDAKTDGLIAIPYRNSEDRLYAILTAQNSTTSTRSTIVSLVWQPTII